MKSELASIAGTIIASIFGLVPAPVIIGCAAGTYASFTWADKIESRSKMWQMFFSCMVMGIAFTIVSDIAIKNFMHMTLTPGGQAAFGAIVSVITRNAMPWLTDVARTGKWLQWVPFIKRSGE